MATFTISLCFLLCFSFLFVSIHSSSSSPYLSTSTFTKNYNKMLMSFKIFIYPSTHRITFYTPAASNFYNSLLNSPFVTREPEEAHLFFVLFSPEITTRSQARLVRELRKKYPYWNRTLGADHFFISPEGIDFSSDRNALELKKNSVQISVFPTISGNFIPHKDISLPPVSTSSLVLSHAPVKTDPSFLGYLKWDGETEAELVEELRLDPEFVVESEPLDHVGRVKSSKFCLFFYEAESTAYMTEAMAVGCVPVVIVDRPVQDFPLMDVLRWSEMALLIGNRRGAQGLKAVLGGVPEDRYERMRGLCVAAAHHMVWNAEPQPYDAFHMVIYQLWMKRHTIRYSRREEF
ncbi:probable glycosyltransferase At5g11130 [Solanum dulcamara]|uniref:probable glycosyltransferase At5g11130 n=1 Tax=Solanum dulcamara TaxID=45834 RepID=UPI0024850746|nr:probable glycosyltransferase At5g11130 [Solanum dulcamara]